MMLDAVVALHRRSFHNHSMGIELAWCMSKKDLAAGLAYELSSLGAIIQPKPQGRAKTDAWVEEWTG